jgi:stress-induced morphogen
VFDAAEIERRIEAALPGALAEVLDEANDGEHFAATVTWAGFSGMSRVAQHQAVYGALSGLIGGAIHALALTTRTPPHSPEPLR